MTIISSLKIHAPYYVTHAALSEGEGDKLILRIVARMIGVEECSSLVKRAIQFGSRIAKVSDKSRFGSQRRATGSAKHNSMPI